MNQTRWYQILDYFFSQMNFSIFLKLSKTLNCKNVVKYWEFMKVAIYILIGINFLNKMTFFKNFICIF